MCKHAVKHFSFVIRDVPDQYKAQKMCCKAILEIVEHQSLFLTAKLIKEMYNKAVDNYLHALKFYPDYYMTQIMRNKAIKLKYCRDRYKAQEMCGKAFDGFLTTLKFIPDWLVTRKMFKKLTYILIY